jgi:SAM-dependent methyltransferase
MQTESRHDDWDQHWDNYAESAKSNPAQRMRRRVIRRLLQVGDGPVRIFDIGCGQGDLIAELHAAYPDAELCGVDYSASGVEIAASKVQSARFIARDLLQPGEPPSHLARWATHAVCSEVLEHVDDPEALMRNAAAYLAPGCRVVVTVPGGPMSAFDRHIGHRQHFTIDSLRSVLQRAGYEVEKSTGVGFPQFNLYRLLVMLRGETLVKDVASNNNSGLSAAAAGAAMTAFRGLFALGTTQSPWGWQMVAVARKPQVA